MERARITEALNETSESLQVGARAVLKAIDMLDNAHGTYLG
jgi:hypothetical protein